ncbi:MAG TPA: amidohydrolase, partial [Mycobacterium sp.]|nr:amidohydrolase [Mycobacterium sp.]
MTLIAVEEHVLPSDLINEVWPKPTTPESLTAKLVDVGEQRLRATDDAAPGTQQVSAGHTDLSRAINDRCAEIVTAHPLRFNALATL